MPVRRSRKGKQGSSAKQAAITAANAAALNSAPPISPPRMTMESTTHVSQPQVTTTSSQPQQRSSSSVVNKTNLDDTDEMNNSNKHHQLILTSDKRRGVYECDYCGCDVSQTPRIRCAICVDFDVCCDCFITTDPMTAMARLQTAQHAMAFQQQQSSKSEWDGGFDSASSHFVAPPQHDPLTHGYRVCDSTRYPLFPINAAVVASTTATTSRPNGTTTSVPTGTINHTTTKAGINNNTSTSARKKKIKVAETETTVSDKIVAEPSKDNDMEGVEMYMPSEHPETATSSSTSTNENDGTNIDTNTATTTPTIIEPIVMSAGDDHKTIWTIEEDLRLLCGIQTHGLGNWTEISEAIVGHGSSGKTPKRCMERYFDDYMGRYGHILPPMTLIGEATTTTSTTNHPDTDDDAETTTAVVEGDANKDGSHTTPAPTASTPGTTITNEFAVRSSKRRSTMLRTPGGTSTQPVTKKYLAVPTESLPEYQHIQLKPFLPQLDAGSVVMGQEVGRDQATKAELAYVRTISGLDSTEQVDRIRTDWEMNRLNKPGGPTVLPMRPDDIPKLPGSEIAGYMPRRGDFDIEYENNAEEAIADMEFAPGESEQDRNLKLAVLAIYHSKLVERNKRKQFIISRKLYDYKSYQEEYRKLPRDERDLVLRMRLFERFHTPEEHKIFIADILKAKRLRKEIAKLQMYRRMGIRTQLEAERYEIDKARRLFHKNAVTQSNDEMTRVEASTTSGAAAAPSGTVPGPLTKVSSSSTVSDGNQESASSQYWKQYRTTDRKVRRSVNRGISDESHTIPSQSSDATIGKTDNDIPTDTTIQQTSVQVSSRNDENGEPMKDMVKADDAMDVDELTTDKDNSIESRECDDKEKDDTQQPDIANDVVKHNKNDVENENGDDDTLLPGYHQLSSREVDLIRSIQISPMQYIQIKKALIYESLQYGLLNQMDDVDNMKDDDESNDALRRIRRNTVASGGSSSSINNNNTNLNHDASHPSNNHNRNNHNNHPDNNPTLFLLDVERRGTMIDFIVQAGWITTQYGKSVV